ncbi:non-ribosomal peptide synthetase [Candidatus Nitrospira bockiana]
MQNSVQGVRLSPQQKRLWSLQSGGTMHTAQCLIRVEGPLRPEAFKDALGRVVARHEIFRTTFQREPGLKTPFQVVEEPGSPCWVFIDLTGQESSEQETAVERLWREQWLRPFDLTHGPLLRAHLLALGPERHALLFTLPALCADARTLRNLADDMAHAYAAGLEPGGEGDEPVQYAQFSEWQHELLAEVEAERGRQYWREQRLAAIPPAALPFHSRTGADPARTSMEPATVQIEPSIGRRLLEVASDCGTSLETVLLAASAVHLWRLCGLKEFTLATLCDGRKYEELQGAMGLLAKWVPLPCRIQASDPFVTLVSRVHAALKEAILWQEYFIWDEEARAPKISDQIGFEFHVEPPAIPAGGVRFAVERSAASFENLKLRLSCRQRGASLIVLVQDDAGAFPREVVERLAAQYASLLDSIGREASARVSDLELLGPAERHQLLVLNNRTHRAFPERRRLQELFEAHAVHRPGAIAVVCEDRALTYAELDVKANQVAHALQRSGAGPGSLIGLCLERSVEMIVGMLGILKGGAAYVPLDPQAPRARRSSQLEQARLPILITQEPLLAQLADYSGRLICLDRDARTLDAEPMTAPPCPADPLDLAYVIYTSGSTGVPKGVAVTHRNVVNYTDGLCHMLQLEEGWHFATVSTLAADLGNTAIFAALASGGCVHVITYETATDGGRFAAYRARHPLDVLKIVPSHLSALLTGVDGREVLPRKYLILGGEMLPVSLVARIRALAPGCAVVNHYGPTETTIGSLTCRVDGEVGDADSLAAPIGRPIANTEAYILDEAMRPVPAGVAGELYIGGAGVSRGYLEQPAQTAERFLPNPFGGAGSRLYRTGDVARYRPEGTIECLGRVDHQIKLRGYRIEPGEIEARLLEHPHVREAVVIPRDEGAAGRHLVAYLVTDRVAPEAGVLRAFLKDKLPDYMIPSVFVVLESLPLTPNGKVDRRALPDPGREKPERAYVPPRTPTEAAVAQIWTELLRLERVGADDSFFDLGGHSLLAIQLLHRIQKSLGVSLSLTAVFEAPTLAGLAEKVEQGKAGASIIVPLRAGGARPPVFCFDPTGSHVSAYRGLAESLRSDRPVYGVELRVPSAPPETLVAAIAKEQVAVIRSYQPEGPYQLVGWSLGGVFALAAAHALQQQGQTVGFLGILDTQARLQLYGTEEEPDPLAELAEYVHLDRRKEVLSLPEQDRRALLDGLVGLDKDERVKAVIRWAQARGLLADDAPAEAFVLRYALLRNAADFMRAGLAPCLRAPIHVWWGSETLRQYGHAPIDWERYTSGSVHAEVVAGDHMEVVNSRRVIERIGKLLA